MTAPAGIVGCRRQATAPSPSHAAGINSDKASPPIMSGRSVTWNVLNRRTLPAGASPLPARVQDIAAAQRNTPTESQMGRESMVVS